MRIAGLTWLFVLATGITVNVDFMGRSEIVARLRDQAPARVEVELINHHDLIFSTDALSIGDPAQILHSIFDTGSFQPVIFSARCLGFAACYEDSVPRDAYDPSNSTTYVGTKSGDVHNADLVELTYGQGTVDAIYGRDKFAVATQLEARLSFLEVVAKQSSFESLDLEGLTAVIGIGKTPVMSKMVEQLGLNKHRSLLDAMEIQRFTVCIGRQPLSSGKLVLNDDSIDSGQATAAFPVDVVGHVHWGLQIQGISLGEESVACAEGACTAIADTGTSLLAVPTQVIQAVMEVIGDVNDDCSNINRLPSLTFKVAGPAGSHDLVIPPDGYMALLDGYAAPDVWDVIKIWFGENPGKISHCVPLLMPQDESSPEFGQVMILGLPLFRQYMATFKHSPPHEIHFEKSPAEGDCTRRNVGTSLAEEQAGGGSFITIDPKRLRVPHQKIQSAVSLL
mmetsp:Transcript_38512/g.81281  ORF Transcript_38512/g.81281 Transcript_38512/m.81281 type:complete len:451 (-) Transcript_38512:44-1396(-)|eukprot:CAMPEP_0204352698 /NCGR_PEP_ID=MMETSP0469-20131031/32084_1 /ASSEMBLY_ACC=CAM_ASM_000384 /TAXON_ID=2969 /ORGANISM="Oxyrrhis marina" /LENGTH=450 /DNA_ID=CAMNT_0051339477 /DNA_START=62 /DNA_END=1414 /DNA_ORIENTATION=-